MKALVLVEYNRFEMQDMPRPEIGPGDVLVRVAACGICGSDIHGMDGSTGRRRPPLVMGHEAAGTVAEVGAGVVGWRPGDRVTFDSTIFCGECWYCRRGQTNLCDNRRVPGVSCEEYRCHGAFAEFVAVPTRVLTRLPDQVSFRHAAMVEPVAIALHAVKNAGIALNDSAVVIGTGMIGLLVVQALRAAGSGRIFAVDRDRARLTLACKLGADEGLSPDEIDVPAEVVRRCDGRGADVALEVVGIAPTVRTAVACLRKGGRLGLVGNLSPSVELPLQAVVTRELTLAGSCAYNGDYPAGLDLMARGAIDVEPLISAVAPLAEGDAWFHRLQKGGEGLLKVILEP